MEITAQTTRPTTRKGNNGNNPKTGDTIKVQPIVEPKDIKAIKRFLASSPRELCLFTLGINTNLRASDILGITVGQVRNLRPMDELVLLEKKTGKARRINLNRAVVEAIGKLMDTQQHKTDEDLLFTGKRGPMTVSYLNRLVKGWCKTINLKGQYGSHTLRKTWGYHQRVTFGRGIPELMVCFNHSNQRQTLDYLCIQPDEIKSVYENEI